MPDLQISAGVLNVCLCFEKSSSYMISVGIGEDGFEDFTMESGYRNKDSEEICAPSTLCQKATNEMDFKLGSLAISLC